MTSFFACIILFAIGLKLGDVAGRRRLLTKKRIRRLFLKATGGHGPWSIGILEGSSPFELTEHGHISNPVLSAKDVTDLDALFVADPFMHGENGQFYMFFETMGRRDEKGRIAVASSTDGLTWQYERIVLEEGFHLSFPNVFTWDGKIYMVPESSDDWSVRLYEADSFPFSWKHVGNLISGYKFKDPSPFFHDGLWWMFVSCGRNEVANLFYAEDLLGKWHAHGQNPIVLRDKTRARSAGRVISYKDRLFRIVQDSSKKYGRQVFAWEIIRLSPDSYEERIVNRTPIVTASGKGWNKAGMHTLNLYEVRGRWLGLVDGRRF